VEEGKTDYTLDTDKLKKLAFKYIGSRVIDITIANHDVFKADNPGMPKVLLFTESKKAPIIFRALSTYFDKTLEFGMIKSDDDALAKQYGVKKYPAFFILKHGEKKPFKYEGESFTYKDLFEFINIYSETFVHPDTTNKDVESAASKPWLS